jgi:hypothetical protein
MATRRRPRGFPLITKPVRTAGSVYAETATVGLPGDRAKWRKRLYEHGTVTQGEKIKRKLEKRKKSSRGNNNTH